MRKIFLVLLSAVTFALNAQEHLRFLGVEITGKSEDFYRSLEQKNARGTYNLTISDYGYAEYEDQNAKWDILTRETPLTGTIYYVTALTSFGEQHSWNKMLGIYNQVKEEFIKKFGVPIEDKMEFLPPYSVNNDPKNAIIQGKASIVCKFEAKGGEVSLHFEPITYESDDLISLVQSFVDKIGQELCDDEESTVFQMNAELEKELESGMFTW